MRQSRGSKVETEARPCETEPAKKLPRGRLEPRQMPRGLHPWWKVPRGPRKTPRGGKLDHIMLGLPFRFGGGSAELRTGRCVTRRLFNGNDFAESATMTEVCDLLSVPFWYFAVM